MSKNQLVFLVSAPGNEVGIYAELLSKGAGWNKPLVFLGDPIGQVGDVASAESSHRLTADTITAEQQQKLRDAFAKVEGDGIQTIWAPRSVFQVDAYRATFPDAKFVMLLRRPVENVLAAQGGWSSGKFVSEPDLPGWWGDKWSFPLIAGWRDLIGAPLLDVAAAQWAQLSATALDDLGKMPAATRAYASFEALVEDPAAELARVTSELGLPWAADPADLTAKALEQFKAQKHSPSFLTLAGAALEALNPHAATVERVNQLRAPISPADKPLTEKVKKPGDDMVTKPSAGTPFASQHTNTLVEVLRALKSSLLVTTYKSGHALILRADEGGLNTAIHGYNRPMGVAVSGSRLAVGTGDAIHSYSNVPGLSRTLQPAGKHDQVFAPRGVVYTGDVAMHEMEYGTADGAEGLWFVNTKFSCLCKQDINYSFEPVWQPEWITELAAEDRCHLNGLAMVDGRPKYVTALSQTDTAGGWRELKGIAGVIIDIETNQLITKGLAMPHSPRWYQNRLWVLESGKGTLATVDIDTGVVKTVATLPGFTRGLAFAGQFAFIGLSQVRDSVFKDLPVTKTRDERNAGVWVVNINTGQIVGFIKFEGVIQEIFDVKLLPGAQWPIIVEPNPATSTAYVLSDETLKRTKKS